MRGDHIKAADVLRSEFRKRPTPTLAIHYAAAMIRAGIENASEYDRLIKAYPNVEFLKAAKMEMAFRTGDHRTAFSLVRSRWALKDATPLDLGIPEDPSGQCENLFVIMEQGLGEQIFLSSMLKDLPPATVATDDRLIPLFRRSFSQHRFVPHLEANALTTPESRYIYSMDMAATRLGHGNRGGWLTPDDHKAAMCRHHLAKSFPGKKSVGLSWRSFNSTFGNHKSIPASDVMPVLANPQFSVIGLQYGQCHEDIDYFRDNGFPLMGIKGLDPKNDIDLLASVISAIDIVITCSNTTAHLAGALGKRTILLLPNKYSFWYWGKGDTTQWYPSVEIIRRDSKGWRSAVHKAIERAL